MKKTLFLLSILLTFLTSCNNDELHDETNSNTTQQSDNIRWYGTGTTTKDLETRGVADADKLWNQMIGIHIKFINNPSNPNLIEKVKQVAKKWQDYAGIEFHFVESSEKASVRIAFNWASNDWLTWSYTGTDAKIVTDQSKPTASFGGLEKLDNEKFEGDVLRLFGQILGLEYEQRHQDWYNNGYWQSAQQLQTYWENQFKGMNLNWSEIRQYVFDPLTDKSAVLLYQTKVIDDLSVMAWPYYTRSQTTKLLANYKLSEGDKNFIGTLYPKTQKASQTIQEAWVDAGYFTWNDNSKTSLKLTALGKQQAYLPNVSDGEQLISANRMFAESTNLKEVPVFYSRNITNFEGMLYGCSALEKVPELDTYKGTLFTSMFRDCTSLTSIPELDISRGTNFAYMFYGCTNLNNVPQLDTSYGTNFSYMFYNCPMLASIPKLDTARGTNFSSMFYRCYSLTSIPLLDTSYGLNFSNMFSGCSNLSTIPLLNTSSGTNFNYMFYNCTSLQTIPLIDTSLGTSFYYMFAYCSLLKSIPNINTSKGTEFGGMFYRCSKLTSKPNLDLSKAKSVTNMYTGTPFA